MQERDKIDDDFRGTTAVRVVAVFLALLALMLIVKRAKAADAFQAFSAIRAYAGLPAVRQDPQLQAEAQRRADNLASRGWKKKIFKRRGLFGRRRGRASRSNHLPGLRCGDREGVGVWDIVDPRGRHFYACGMNRTGYSRAGAATSVRGRSTFYVLIWE